MRINNYLWIQRIAILLCIVPLLWPINNSFAAAVPAYAGGVNRAVSSIVKFKQSKWGFSALDPRFKATMDAIGGAATSIAVGVATGAVATVGWPALLIGAGVSAVASGAFSLGVGTLIDWIWGSGDDQKDVTLSGSGMGVTSLENIPLMPDTYPAMIEKYGANRELFFVDSAWKIRRFKTVDYLCLSSASCSLPPPYNSSSLEVGFSAPCSSASGCAIGSTAYWGQVYVKGVAGNPYRNQVVWELRMPSGQLIGNPGYQSSPKPVSQAIADLPQAASSAKLSPEMLAAIVNTMWKNAAADSTPNTIPWSASDPITPADILEWQAANPSLVPTVGDFIGPVAPPGSNSVPFPLPNVEDSSETDTHTGTGAGTSPTIDMGEDPHVGAPELEETPTASMILDPILNLLPDLRSFQVPAHSASCPRPSYNILGREFRLESHCDLLERYRSLIETACMLAFTILAITNVLRA